MRVGLHIVVGCAAASLACGGLPVPAPDPLAKARIAVAAGEGVAPDTCHENGWVRVALRELDAALRDRPELLAKADADPALAALRSTDAWARWRAARSADLRSTDGIGAVLGQSSAWHDATGGAVSLSLLPDGTAFLGREDAARTMEGRWAVVDGEVELVLGGTSLHAALVPGDLGVELDAGRFGRFEQDPRICPPTASPSR